MNIRLTFQEKEAEFRVGFEASSEFSLLFDESNGTSLLRSLAQKTVTWWTTC